MKKFIAMVLVAGIIPACTAYPQGAGYGGGTSLSVVIDITELQGGLTSESNRIDSIVGNISNSYVVVNGGGHVDTVIPFDFMNDGHPAYQDGSGNNVVFDGGWGVDLVGVPVSSSTSGAVLPPFQDWTNGVTVEFHQGQYIGTDKLDQTIVDDATSIPSGAAVTDALAAQLNIIGKTTRAGVTSTHTNAAELLLELTNSNTHAELLAGEYTLGTTNRYDFSGKENISLVCPDGIASISGYIPTGSNSFLVSFENSTNVLMQNIHLYCPIRTNEFGSGHAYGMVFQPYSGMIKDCTVLTKNELTQTQMPYPWHSISFVNLPATNRQVVIERCSFIALNTNGVTSAITQCAAVHSTGVANGPARLRTIFRDCNFIKSKSCHYEVTRGTTNSTTDVVDGVAEYISCRSTILTPFMFNCGLMTRGDAYARVPAQFRSSFGETDGYLRSFSHGTGDIFYSGYSLGDTNNTVQTMIRVLSDPTRTVAARYRFVFDGQVSGTGYPATPILYDVVTTLGTNIVQTNLYYSPAVASLGTDGSNITVRVTHNSGNADIYLSGFVKVICDPYVSTNSPGAYGSSHYLQLIEDTPIP